MEIIIQKNPFVSQWNMSLDKINDIKLKCNRFFTHDKNDYTSQSSAFQKTVPSPGNRPFLVLYSFKL